MAESVRPLPSPWGGQKKGEEPVTPPEEETPPAVRLVTFDNPYEGPTDRDNPAVPKPITPLSPVVSLPDVQTIPVGSEGSLEYIAKAMAQIIQQPSAFVTGNVPCLIANRGYQLPNYQIPLFCQVVIQAWFTNVGIIYVAYRQSDAQNAAVGFPLIANAGVGYRIQNTSSVWVMATVAGEGASFTVEQI